MSPNDMPVFSGTILLQKQNKSHELCVSVTNWLAGASVPLLFTAWEKAIDPLHSNSKTSQMGESHSKQKSV